MFKKVLAATMAAAMVAMLPMIASAEIDRELLEKKMVEHLWDEDRLYEGYDGYDVAVEDNPTSSLEYCLYIKPFVYESDESFRRLPATSSKMVGERRTKS